MRETTTAPAMSRGHFQLIADVLASAAGDRQTVDKLAEAFARELGRTNPRFNIHRFLTAAGVPVSAQNRKGEER